MGGGSLERELILGGGGGLNEEFTVGAVSKLSFNF